MGGCTNKPRWLVNGRWREAQVSVCAIHLAGAIKHMSQFNDARYKRRVSDRGVMVYPNPKYAEDK